MEKKMSYEEALERLNEIVKQLESGEETLESSMKLFEEGAKLTSYCLEMLDSAEQKITELSEIRESDEE